VKELRLDRDLCLSQEEALGLLEIAMLAPGDLTSEQRSAIVKLSDFCRECLRSEVDDVRDIASLGRENAFSVTVLAA